MPNGTGSRCVRPTLQGRYGHTPMTWDLRFTIRPFPHDHHCTTAKWSEMEKVKVSGRAYLLCSYGRPFLYRQPPCMHMHHYGAWAYRGLGGSAATGISMGPYSCFG